MFNNHDDEEKKNQAKQRSLFTYLILFTLGWSEHSQFETFSSEMKWEFMREKYLKNKNSTIDQQEKKKQSEHQGTE